MPLRNDFDQLVDVKGGFISREIFVDADIYRQELDKVFTRAWLLVGHESLVPNPGDFYTSRMGEESVILCRDKKGEIRGGKLVKFEFEIGHRIALPQTERIEAGVLVAALASRAK